MIGSEEIGTADDEIPVLHLSCVLRSVGQCRAAPRRCGVAPNQSETVGAVWGGAFGDSGVIQRVPAAGPQVSGISLAVSKALTEGRWAPSGMRIEEPA
jgi:hypothetical protein